MSKKLIIIIIVILLLIGIGIGLYFWYKNTSLIVITTPQNSQILVDNIQFQNNTLTKLAPGDYTIKVSLEDYIPYSKSAKVSFGANISQSVTLRKLPVPEKALSDTAKFAVLSEDLRSMYLLSSDGKAINFIENILNKNLISEPISPSFFTNVLDIVWAPNRELAVVKEKDQTLLYDFKRYDLLHQEYTEFQKGVGNIAWSPDSKNMIYYYAPETKETTLIKSNEANTDQQIIYNFKDTNIRNPKLSWSPDGLDILLVDKGQIHILNLYSKNLSLILPEQNILEAEFTPDNNILFITKENAFIVDKSGQNLKKLSFSTSLDKINFIDSENLILVEKTNGIEKFYKYNTLSDDKIEFVYNTKYKLNPTNPILTTNEELIYFESNGFLYRMTPDIGGY